MVAQQVAAAPAVDWRRTDFYPTHPVSGAQTQAQSGEDWWYDEASSHSAGVVDGYICAGYSSFVNYAPSEAGSGGCYLSTLGGPDCNELESAGNVKGDIVATMALIAPDGASRLWIHSYNQGYFYRVIQTSDGGYLAVGRTGATRTPGGASLYYNPGQHAGSYTDAFDAGTACSLGEAVTHAVIVKVDASGVVQWQYLYGTTAYRNGSGTPDPSTAYHNGSDAWDIVETSSGNFRVVGLVEDQSHTYFCNSTNSPISRAWMLEIDATGHWVWDKSYGPDTAPSIFTAITAYGSGAGTHFAVSGTEWFTGTVSNPFTGCQLFQRATVQLFDDSVQPAALWMRNDFDPSTTESQSTHDVAVATNGDILLPLVVHCQGCLYASTNIGRAKVYRLFAASGGTRSACELTEVTAYDLKVRVTPTADNGYGVVSTKQVNAPPAPYSCYDTGYWNTDAYVAKVNALSNVEWETTFSVDNAAPAPYPSDLKKQECLYSISEGPDGGLVVGGNNSYDFDDDYLAKLGTAPTPQCVTPPPNMTAWWSLDEYGGALVFDRVGNAGGHIVGAVTHPAGKVARGIHIGEDDAYVAVPDKPALNFGVGDYSADAWVRTFDTSTSVRTILDKRQSGAGGYSMYISFGHLGCQIADAGGYGNFTSSGPNIADGAWHHVAMTVNRASGLKKEGGSLWADGAHVLDFDPLPWPGSVSNTNELRIGQAFDGSSLSFNGDIDEVEIFDRCLGVDEVQLLAHASSAGKCKIGSGGCFPPPSQMVAWWPLDETSGSAAGDLLGLSSGVLQGGASHASGKVAGALGLVGASDYVSVPDGAALNFAAGSFALDAWVRCQDTTTDVRTILDKRSSAAATGGYSLFISYGRLGFQLKDASGFTNYALPNPGPLTDGAWHHVAACVDRGGGATGGQLYIDGALILTFDPTLRSGSASNPGELRLGQAYDNSSISFDGQIDEVELFDRALGSQEVAAIYQAGSSGKCKPAMIADVPPAAPARSGFLRLGNNPLASGNAEITFALSAAGRAEVRIFDLAGRLVRVLASARFDAGEHTLSWDGHDGDGQPVSRGVYFAQVILPESGVREAKRVVLLK